MMFNLLNKAPPKKRLLYSELEQFINTTNSSPIALISGMRRTGKTALFAQIAREYQNQKSVLYLNFRDEQVYSSCGNVEAERTAEQALYMFLEKPDHEIILLDEVTCLEDYETLCANLFDLAAAERGGWKYKVLATCSSPFHIKVLSSGALGGSRSRLYYLPVIKFVEYLHLTTDYITYDDYRNVNAQDFENYLDLKNLPEDMLRTFDEDYFLNYYEELSGSDNNTMNRAGESRLTSDDLTHFSNMLAYQIAGRISYDKLLKNNPGKYELAAFGGRKKFAIELTDCILEVSKTGVKHLISSIGHSSLARLLHFLLKSHVINAETELNLEDENSMDIGLIMGLLNKNTTHGELVKLFDKVSFSLNSPLLYTRLGKDILDRAGFSWAEFSSLPPESKNSLYGNLLELYIRGGVSELNSKSLPFTSTKLSMSQVAEIDIVNHRLGLLCETTMANKDGTALHIATRYKDYGLIRVCATADLYDVKECYYQIPYPLLCCMVDTGDILQLQRTTAQDTLDIKTTFPKKLQICLESRNFSDGK